jgi:hypothetical protein
MKTHVRLVPLLTETSYAPLGAVGYCLTHSHFLDLLWQGLALDLKTVDHTPADKLLDALVSVLAGCRAISEINTRLRPDRVLAQAWGRRAFAEQSTVARTLDAFGPQQVQNLRCGSEALFRRESRCLQHDLAADWLWFDIDLTPLPISKRAEGSTKGKFAKKRLRPPAGSGPCAAVSRDLVLPALPGLPGKQPVLLTDGAGPPRLPELQRRPTPKSRAPQRCRLRQ